MPSFYSNIDGVSYELSYWPGGSYKSIVINRALARGDFSVGEWLGKGFLLFECEWCHYPVTSSGVQGDHIVTQNAANTSRELAALSRNAGLVLSCAECNGGT